MSQEMKITWRGLFVKNQIQRLVLLKDLLNMQQKQANRSKGLDFYAAGTKKRLLML